MNAPAQALSSLAGILGELNIQWVLVGSMASSIHGTVRTTQDVDVVIRLPPGKLTPLTEALDREFSADPELKRENFALGRPANIFHKESYFKIDIFPVTGDTAQRAQLERARIEEVMLDAVHLRIPVSTAEDILVAKLRWWRAAGESYKQWEDMRGLLIVSRAKLDISYIRAWAGQLNPMEPLERLLHESEAR